MKVLPVNLHEYGDQEFGRVLSLFDTAVSVDDATGCWVWTGALSSRGYGVVYAHGRHIGAHRVALALAGVEPGGMFVMHKCDNPPCVNPDHLSLGTPADNIRDSVQKGRHYKQAITRCPAGHEYTPENTNSNYGFRLCRACYSNRAKERRKHDPERTKQEYRDAYARNGERKRLRQRERYAAKRAARTDE